MPADSQTAPNTGEMSRTAGSSWQVASILTALLLGGGLSVGMFLVSRTSEQRQLQSQFERSASAFVSAFRIRIEDTILLLDSLAALYDTSEGLNREQFQSFAQHLFRHHRGIQAMEWIPRVPHTQRERHEQEARADGMAGYVISERGAADEMVPAVKREEYFPVYFVEPLVGNEQAVGFDLGSDPVRQTALQRSWSSGVAVSTARIRLVQEQAEQFGVLVFQPIYAERPAPVSVDARRETLQGFMLIVLRVGDLVDTAIEEFGPGNTSVAVFDDSAPEEHRFLYSRSPEQATKPDRMSYVPGAPYTGRLEMATREWRVVCTPAAEALGTPRTWLPWGIFSAGLVASSLLAGLVLFVSRSARQAQLHAAATRQSNIALNREIEQRQAVEARIRASEVRYRALADENARLLEETRRREEEAQKFALLVENSDDFVGIASLEGEVLFINRAGRDLVGLDPHTDLSFLTIDDFLTEEGKQASREIEVPAVKANGHWSGETTLRHFHTGKPIPVSVNSFLTVDPHTNEPTALATVQRDITERKRASEEKTRLLEQARHDAATKTTLLEEVNHRVKNNLSSIVGLLVAQQRFAPQKQRASVRTVAQELVGRVEALAVVHRMLSSRNWSPVPLSGLASEIIRASLQAVAPGREVEVDVAPSSVTLTPGQANSMGIVLNELATNSLKHGLKDGRGAHLSVGFAEKSGQVVVTFRDNGAGYPQATLESKQGGSGLYLMNSLIEAELLGSLELRNDHGAVAEFTFERRRIDDRI